MNVIINISLQNPQITMATATPFMEMAASVNLE
jgi:hypothetical protein